MDDFSGVIESFLSQPDAMEQLQAMAQALGLDSQEGSQPSQPSQSSTPDDLISPAQLMAVMSAMNEASGPNDCTSLLEALRPMLRCQGKVNRAIRALQLTNAAKSVSKVWKG